MGNSKIKLASLILAVMMTASCLGGCGDKKDQSSGESSGSDNSTAEQDLSYLDKIPESAKGQTLQFATWIDHTQTESARVISSFIKKTGVKVELWSTAQTEYISKLSAAIASGKSPDVLVTNSEFQTILKVAQPVTTGGIDPTDKYWDQNITKVMTVGGKCYGVNSANSPWYIGGGLVFYNKTVMEENGIKTPGEYYEEGNWNYKTMEACIKQCDALGGDYQGCFFDGDILAPGQGGALVKYKDGKFFNGMMEDNYLSCLRWVATMNKEGHLSKQNIQSFFKGKILMWTTNSFGLRKTGHFAKMNTDDLGFTYLPTPDDGKPVTTMGRIRSYGIVQGSKNPEAAAAFIRYYLDYNNYDEDEIFFSDEAKEMYFNLMKLEKDREVVYGYDGAVCNLYDSSSSYTLYQKLAWGLKGQDPAQLTAYAQSLNNELNAACDTANKLIAEVIERDKNIG